MTVEIVQLVPHKKAGAFRRRGWKIKPLNCHHGAHCVLAVKMKKRGKRR